MTNEGRRGRGRRRHKLIRIDGDDDAGDIGNDVGDSSKYVIVSRSRLNEMCMKGSRNSLTVSMYEYVAPHHVYVYNILSSINFHPLIRERTLSDILQKISNHTPYDMIRQQIDRRNTKRT